MVTGLVQGVGYRYWALREARRLGVAGWARNAFDGSVEIVAQGTQPAVDAFLSALADGPSHARVAGVTRQAEPVDAARSGFEIRH